MRTIVVLLLALFAFLVVLAKKDDVACVVHSDDCGKCVSNGCNWCSDGYCVSAESDICEANKVMTTCDAKLPTIEHQQKPRQSQVCESITDCSQCVSPCNLCKDNNYKLFKCSSQSTCEPSEYALAYEWWVPAMGLTNLTFTVGNVCPIFKPASTSSPVLRMSLAVYLYGNGDSCADLQFSFVIGTILHTLQAILAPPIFDGEFVIITSCTISSRKRTIQTDLYEANLLVKFADFGDITAQGIAATLVDESPEVFSVDKTGPPISVGPYLPGTGSTGQVVQNRRGNNNASLSKGALAGIIIGCIVFGAILIALILWLIMRRRDSYPQAFRSPAAAYRP